MIHPLPRFIRSKYCPRIIYCSLVLPIISLLLIQIQAFPGAPYVVKEIKRYVALVSPAQGSQQTQQLDPGKAIERGLESGESHYYAYQLTLAAGQYAKLMVEQRGIDVVVKLFGPDGKQLSQFDSEFRIQGQETVELVAEEAGSYRLDISAKYKNAAAGRYEIRLLELRSATENDRALYEASKLNAERARLDSAGKYDEARPLGERVVQIRERVLGPEHPDVAAALNSLAFLYFIKADYGRAETLYQRALAIGEKALAPEHPSLAIYLENLANLYSLFKKEDFDKAEQLYQRALAIRKKSLGAEHPLVFFSLNNLATLYQLRGDYVKAEPLYRQALTLAEKLLGPEHPDVAKPLNNLAFLYYQLAYYQLASAEEQALYYGKAEPLYQRALAIKEKVLGPEHPDVASSLYSLASLYVERGDYTKAEQFFQRARVIREKALGPEHPDVAFTLKGLAVLRVRRGDYTNAEPLYQRALAIMEKTLSADSQPICDLLYNLGVLYSAKGDIAQAIAFVSRANASAERNLAFNLTRGSENRKNDYLALALYLTDLTLTLQSQIAPNDPQALDLGVTTLLRRKGRALDAMTDTIATLRRRATREDQEVFNKLAEARSQLASLKLKDSNAGPPDIYRARVKALEDDVEKLEGELSSRSDEFRTQLQAQTQPVTMNAVQAALPPGSALVEFAYFTPRDPQTEKRRSSRYLAYVLPGQGRPKWVDLGESAKIDLVVDSWREALRDPNRTDVRLLARTVDEKVMRPVRALLGDTRRLLIAPDSKLNLIPFSALVDEQNQYLIERFSISYLTSGRDLLRLQTPQPSKNGPLVVANPDFGRFATIAMGTDRGSGKARARLDSSQIFFQPLPGTEDEALAIKALLPKASVLRREQATETALKQASGPRILHIATHGFFLDNQDTAAVENNPLRIDSPETVPVLASTDANPYTVQFDATQEFETAQEKAKGLRTRGLNAYIVKSELKGKGTFFRVRAGNFRTQTEAQKYGAELQEKGVVSDFFVTRYEAPQRALIEQDSAPNESLVNLRLSKFATKVEDPLLRSGLALAGANQGKSGDDDGVLTALEAASLDLAGTKLVVLSACDTGVGEVKNGEGVQGLRRALVLAGSESQVMSLWPVSDEAAKDLMIPYYKALQQGEGRSEGLRQVQLRMLRGRKDQRHPFFWAAFIQSGEWANLDGQR
jgi:CHAT domain-containing protein/Tfp pilus assembly protein PilF